MTQLEICAVVMGDSQRFEMIFFDVGALAFESVMAFEGGGIVPGVTLGDSVPAMLTPGEGVLPKSLTEGLTNVARSGNMGGGHTTHVHVRPSITSTRLTETGCKRRSTNTPMYCNGILKTRLEG